MFCSGMIDNADATGRVPPGADATERVPPDTDATERVPPIRTRRSASLPDLKGI